MTLLSAPESIQGALAAGPARRGVTLPRGDRGRGRVARLGDRRARHAARRRRRMGRGRAARPSRAQKSAGRFVPGLGHPVHKQGDPRTPVLIAMAREHGQYGPHLALFEAIGRVHAERARSDVAAERRGGVRGGARRHRDPARRHPRRGLARALRRAARATSPRSNATRSAMDMYTTMDRNTDYQPSKRS